MWGGRLGRLVDMLSLPTATSLERARSLQLRYSDDSGYMHVIVLGECNEDRQTYYVVTTHEAKRLLADGFELLEEP